MTKVLSVSMRTKRILNFFLVVMVLILIRVWYLSIIQYDRHYQASLRPQRRSSIERVERGSIRDRFNIPLAVNKIQYNAAICYSEIRQIPGVKWEKDEKGGKKRVLARQAYISELSQFLAETLELDPQTIEDMINGKACLFPHTPFVLKEDISEKLYLKLKMEERNWLGLKMQRATQRVYPKGKLACDVIGYMGAIGEQEYLKIAAQMEELKLYLEEHNRGRAALLPRGFSSPQEVKDRLKELQERSYTINDQIGKSGVEAFFDEQLRGHFGKKIYEIDIKGNATRQLPGGKAAVPGERLILSLSSELQLEAEKLLAEYEYRQEKRDKTDVKRNYAPWQRGGAVVVMHPKSGEILALASYPRFNPNDLIPAQTFEKRKKQRSSIIQWLESEAYVGEIWDGKRPMQREYFSNREFFTEELALTWETYLNTILAKKSPIYQNITAVKTINQALSIQQEPQNNPYLEGISHPQDQQLFMDLIQMVVDKEHFTQTLLENIGQQSLADFRLYCQTIARHLSPLKELTRESFHNRDFKNWRKENFQDFMKGKRSLEKANKRYSRPYTEYLEKKETELFNQFWEKKRWELLYSFVFDQPASCYAQEISFLRKTNSDPLLDSLKNFLSPLNYNDQISYLKALRCFEDLKRPIAGKYPSLRSLKGVHYEKHLAGAFYPYTGFGYGRSHAFRQATPLGSIFKLIPSYAALKQQYLQGASDLNPLMLTDDMQWTSRPGSSNQVLGYHENGEVIKRFYKGGQLPRAHPKIGQLNLVRAIERTSNIYFSILAGDFLKSPSALLNAAIEFGMGTKTGIDLPGEYDGILPNDVFHDKTNLYAFAIGQHSLVVTPLQAATMLSAIANGGKLLKPQIVKLTAGKSPQHSLFSQPIFPYKEALNNLGIAFPLFTRGLTESDKDFIDFQEPVVKSSIFLPKEVREILLQAMHQVTNGDQGTARLGLQYATHHSKAALDAFRKLHPQIIGKTGTAEIFYKPTLDFGTLPKLEKHTWFGAISFEDEKQDDPELVVVVYLRFGSAGKQGAPIAARLIERWREIKASH